MGFLELLLVIVLAKAAEQFGRLGECAGIQAGGIGTQFRDGFYVDQQGAAKHSVLAHQVLYGTDLLLLAWLFAPLGRRRGGQAQG
jgi:hypothetical protein